MIYRLVFGALKRLKFKILFAKNKSPLYVSQLVDIETFYFEYSTFFMFDIVLCENSIVVLSLRIMFRWVRLLLIEHTKEVS
jgi:hypothetical protein